MKKEKNFYGAVTVGERGQVVIPAQARRDFGIKPGDKLLVFGRKDKGIAILKARFMVDFAAKILESLKDE